ncbi:hypothetical protein [Halococcus thailandensis]|uniref:Uncharacterized protein n=1 Tax=Halococcus thailandensis JCM 13552 TaxID=1227457 RepID=M0N388_9EURY|nr:hypothetical protein [Halococcus thailandensis]EMA51564.1 hypothetical protein C451_14905 [Halococcus thailandensis JCM 13552]
MDHDERVAADGSQTAEAALDDRSTPNLLSRILVTWIELTVVAITGGLAGASIGGPVGFILSLATTLLTVAIVFHNVNELVKEWLRFGQGA